MGNNALADLDNMHQATLREVADQEHAAAALDLPIEVLTELSAATRFSRREIVRIRRHYQHLPLDAFAGLIHQASAHPTILYEPVVD